MTHREGPKPCQRSCSATPQNCFLKILLLATLLGRFSVSLASEQIPPPLEPAAPDPCATDYLDASLKEPLRASKEYVSQQDPKSAVELFKGVKTKHNCPVVDCKLAFFASVLQKKYQHGGTTAEEKEAAKIVQESGNICATANYLGLSPDDSAVLSGRLRTATDVLSAEPRRLLQRKVGLSLTIVGAALAVPSAIAMGVLAAYPIAGDNTCQYAMSLGNQPCVRYYSELTIPLLAVGVGSLVAGGVLLCIAKKPK